MYKSGSLLNGKTSHILSRLKNQKKVSLLRRSSSLISEKIKKRESVVTQIFVLLFNLVDRMTTVQKYFEVGRYFISLYWYGFF